METIRKTVDPSNPDPEVIREAADWIKKGWPVAFPTETVYGLGADAFLPEAAKRIYEAKGRPSDNPLIIHIAQKEDLAQVAEDVPAEAKALADAFWPGPLTMILKKRDEVPRETTGGLDTVAIRMPSHPVAAALIKESGGFIAAPSANTSGRPSPTRAEHVAEDLSGRIPFLIDGGEVGLGIESTIVDLSVPEPVILRPGSITAESLSKVIGSVRLDPGLKETDANVRPKAPGMKYRHYAPRAELVLVEGSQEDVVRCINERTAGDDRCGVICSAETKDSYRAAVVKCIGSRQDPGELARNLYRILREFDSLPVNRIYSEVFSDNGVGTAVMNRLKKAAGHRIIRAAADN